MKQGAKLGMTGAAGLLIVSLVGVLPAQVPVAPPAPDPGTAMLIAQALGRAIDGTSTQLTARRLAVHPERKGKEAEAALESLRKQARTAYEDARTMLEDARKRVGGSPGGSAYRPLYEAAVRYLETMWALAGEAAPVAVPKGQAEAASNLGVADLAALEAINHTVRGAVGAFELEQLAIRLGSPEDAAIRRLREKAGAMAEASKKASLKFPTIPETALRSAEARLDAATTRIEAARGASESAKAVEGLTQDPRVEEAAKVAKKEAKAVKKEAEKAKKQAEKARRKAEAARKDEIGDDVRPSLETLARQGRELVLILHQMTEGLDRDRPDQK
ncbi:MAG: hypothetical protein IRY99_14170 [Isosphaeraceae bacterium]|nr:hypothetical protein [Isosphaeraceae bacterium]